VFDAYVAFHCHRRHNLDLVLALADRVFALERGAVVHQGPAKPLLDDLAYRKKILWL
jgi:ABC-type branched-subunit amino acid transport system ATPase component